VKDGPDKPKRRGWEEFSGGGADGAARVVSMDPKYRGPSMVFAPPRANAAALSFPPPEHAPEPRFPAVDERLVKPEVTRDEVIRGRKLVAAPALGPHGDAHADVDAVVRWHVREGYRASIDLLTRVSEGSDFATDLSIRREGEDPRTGKRHLEELSFEIVNEQSMRDVREKAEELALCGVRRVFAIFVRRGEVCEWSHEKRVFVPLDLDGMIEDPCFVRPMATRALLDVGVARVEVVLALERQGNPSIEAIKARAEQKGRRELFLQVLRGRFGDVPRAAEAQVEAASAEALESWAKRLFSAETVDDVFG
jgi:hypothetical protein